MISFFMKFFFLIIFFNLLLFNFSSAEMKIIEEKHLDGKHKNYTIATVCIDGHKFVITARGDARSIVQFFTREDADLAMKPPQPSKCK